MIKKENTIKLFGMANQLISADLERIENDYNINLGHTNHNHTGDEESQYYAQFESDVKKEASKMSEHYEVFYCLEKSIRKTINEIMIEDKGINWWDTNSVPKDIKDEVKKRIKKEIDSGVTPRSDDNLDFTTFGELSKIITTNWDLFDSLFSSKNAVIKIMNTLNTIRGPIAHCCPLSEDESLRLNLAVKDWFRLME